MLGLHSREPAGCYRRGRAAVTQALDEAPAKHSSKEAEMGLGSEPRKKEDRKGGSLLWSLLAATVYLLVTLIALKLTRVL